jgi:DNA repair protein RecO (recombination protein O)
MGALNRIQKVEAVIITHRNYGEADRILRVFTPELGKISLLAKGVRKSGSRKAPHIEPFTHAGMVLARGQNFWILTQADTLEQFPNINGDLYRTGLAAYMLELADRLTVDDQPDATIFRLLLDAIKQINSSEDAFIPSCYYEIRLLDITGFRPELFRCVSCGSEIIKQDQFFSIEQGGVVCPNCKQFQRNLIPASQEALKYLRHLQRSNYKKIEDLKLSVEFKNEIRRILDPYVSSVTERKLNSPVFIQQINELDDQSS